MLANNFQIDVFASRRGVGALIVTDHEVLLPGNTYDRRHFAKIMDLGMTAYDPLFDHKATWVIASGLPLSDIFHLLRVPLNDYFQAQRMLTPQVTFVMPRWLPHIFRRRRKKLSPYRGQILIFPREFWIYRSADRSGLPLVSNWHDVLTTGLGLRDVPEIATGSMLDDILTAGLYTDRPRDLHRLVVARPASNVPRFTARGYYTNNVQLDDPTEEA